MTKLTNGLFFIADGWGATKGGINAFNYDLCIALGKIAERYCCKVFCVCSGTVPHTDKKFAAENNVEIVPVDPDDFENRDFSSLDKHVNSTGSLFWIGHDIITGEHALKCCERFGGKTVLFHHMDYEAYYSAKADGRETKKKIDQQKRIFGHARLMLGVGPKLYESLKDKFPDIKDGTIEQIVPGLSEIECIENVSRRTRLVFTGRVEDDNDCVKQFKILIKAFGELVKERDVTPESSVTLIGLPHENYAELEKKYKNAACECADGFSNVLCQTYTENREKLFSDLRQSSIAVMPSLSEGFGLAGLEAISAGVPLVLTKNSGLYKFLEEKNLSGYTDGIEIKGYIGNDVNADDVQNLRKILKDAVKDIAQRKKRALELKEKLLEANVTWQACAERFLDLLGIKQLNKRELLLLSMIDPQVFADNDGLRKYAVECACTCDKEFIEEDEFERSLIIDETEQEIVNFDDLDISLSDIMDMGDAFDEYDLEWVESKTEKRFIASAKKFLDNIVSEIKKSNDLLGDDRVTKFIDDDLFDGFQSDELFTDFDIEIRRNVKNGLKRAAINARVKAVLDAESERLLSAHHEELGKRNDYLDFEGLSIMISSGAHRIPLDEVYAEMNIRAQDSDESDWNSNSNKSMLERLLENRRTVILGDPGTGKSTLMKKLITEACSADGRKNRDISQMCVCVHISEFSNWLNSDGTKAVQDDKSGILDKYIKERSLYCADGDKKGSIALYDKLRALGGVIYFIDGLDEVKNLQEKSAIKSYISELASVSKHNVFIVTSRKVGFDASYRSYKFKIAEIEPLSTESINDYISKWFAAVKILIDKENDTHAIEQKTARLIAIVCNEPSLKALAKNPLLLSIIVILHYHGINLPNNKVKLYETISKTLLETWIEKRGVSESRYDVEFLTGFFSKVGYEIIENNYDNMYISETRLRDIYVEYVSDLTVDGVVEITDGSFDELVGYISEQAGILLYKGPLGDVAYYGFLMHRQFTEYYAAIELEGIIESGDKNYKPTDYISEPKWIEVLTLVGCYMNTQMSGGKQRVNKVIRKILQEKSKPLPELDYNLQMVLKLVSNNVFINAENIADIGNRLAKIFESDNIYKILQFKEELINILNSDYNDWIIKFLMGMLGSDNYICVRNACVIVNSLYKRRDTYADALTLLSDPVHEYIATAFAKLVENESDMRRAFSRVRGYFYTLFMANFVDYVNGLSDEQVANNGLKEKIESLMSYYTLATPYRTAFFLNFGNDRNFYPFDRLVKKSKEFKKKEFADLFINDMILRSYAFKRASSDYVDKRIADIRSDGFDYVKNLIRSADELSKLPMPKEEDTFINLISITKGFKICYGFSRDKHNFIVFTVDKRSNELKRYDFSVSKKFSVQGIKDRMNENRYTANNDALCRSCLEISYLADMTDDELSELYKEVSSCNYTIINHAWKKPVLMRIAEDESFFYDNYNELVGKGIFREKEKSVKLNGTVKICADIFSESSTGIGKNARRELVKSYREMTDEKRKTVLYDVIDKVSNPFRGSK